MLYWTRVVAKSNICFRISHLHKHFKFNQQKKTDPKTN